MSVLIVGGLRIRHVLLTGAAVLPGRHDRDVLEVRVHPRSARLLPRGARSSHQVQQAFIALGSGRPLGQGLGAGTGKLFFLPEVAGDFIFPAIGEEIGFVGVAVVIGLFMAFAWCGWRIARAALDVRPVRLPPRGRHHRPGSRCRRS